MDHHLRALQDLRRTGDRELEQPPKVTSESGRPTGTERTCASVCVQGVIHYVPVAITQGLCVKSRGCWRPFLAPKGSRLQVAWAQRPFSLSSLP